MGRVKTYEAIVKGEAVPKPGIPGVPRDAEGLQSLGLDMRVQDRDGNAVDMQVRNMTMTMADNSGIGDNVLLESELQDDYSQRMPVEALTGRPGR